MIDIEKAEKEFENFLQNYDRQNGKIASKIDHTYRTIKVSREIAKSLNLDSENIKLAEVIGLLHDLGRFEQLNIYDTFDDKKSIDHGDLAVKLLFQDNLIVKFIKERKYDNIIYKAIKNHNKYSIEEGLNEEELLHAKIIRDADKTDIFEVMVRRIENEKELYKTFNREIIKKQFATPEVLEEFLKHKIIDITKIKNQIDKLILYVAFIYDYNFYKGLEIIKEKKYIQRMLSILDNCKETEGQTELIQNTALEFLSKQIN